MKRISLLVICYSIFLFSFTPQSALADPDCSTNQVSLGEVMAGLQAGLTSAGITEETLASGFFDASSISGSPTRGFVIPEAGFDTQHCENDYILIGEQAGCNLNLPDGTKIMKPKEARDCVDAGINGFIVELYFKINGVRIEHMQTATKIGINPNNPEVKLAFWSAGIIIEPFELPPGPYTATAVFVLDFDQDGNPPFFDEVISVNFQVFPE